MPFRLRLAKLIAFDPDLITGSAPMALAEVRTLYESNVRSIPDMLEMAAASIASESEHDDCSPTKAVCMIQLAENGEVQIYGWGDTDDLHCLGMIERGKHELLNILADD